MTAHPATTSHEAILAEIPSSADRQRILVVMTVSGGVSQLELRHQSFGEGVGWFTQHTLPVESSQVAALRGALQGRSLPARTASSAQHLRIYSADSA